ncbi:MAG: hydantoinase B/oxoprolinase family protein [Desulfobacterales bacterium]|nr:hydantoinase B/oxoprolinase family protein [Desulfobacterales bacterium]
MTENPILLEIFKNRFAAIAQEMGVTLKRTAFSPNIKERQDFSCAVFDKNGDMISQAAHIPVHLGSMGLSVRSAIAHITFDPGDMAILNDPYKGGTHLPDITVISPVFINNDTPDYFTANRAHHADVGGIAPGSMPLSKSIYQEGLIIPPVKIMKNGKRVESVMQFILNNVRTPVEREGDFSAQFMANITGEKRIRGLVKKYGNDTVNHYAKALMNYSERIMRRTIQDIPDGTYGFEDFLDDDGCGNRLIRIRAEIRIDGESAIVDFEGTGAQVDGCVNAVYAITLSAVYYVFRSLISENIPTNAGCFRPVTIKTRKGTLVDAVSPAAVAGGNVETSQRIVDVLLGALSKAVPERIPAASQGTMNNVAIGGVDKNNGPFAYYETIGGGMGASASCHGADAVQSHMTNTLNTPVEALEYSYPFMVTEYSIRKDSGGKGTYNGGNGIVREIKLLSGAEVTVLSERRSRAPYGLSGGCAGMAGKNFIKHDGKTESAPAKFHQILKENDCVRIETPGGGGYGKNLS